LKPIFRIILPIIIGYFAAGEAIASPAVSISYSQYQLIQSELVLQLDAELNQLTRFASDASPLTPNLEEEVKYKKLKAILLGVALGHFGVHRIYLGTKPNVPIAYSLTLGGGFGLIPLVDVIALIATKDISKYENNDQFIMWMR
jgi:TM2 domain-containing membrane protein YozV